MGKPRASRVVFPLAGLNRKASYRQSPPFSTTDCLNVVPFGPIEGRERGGSRPGLVLSHIDDLGSNVNLLAPMILALGNGFQVWSDTFSGASMASVWTQASWASNVPSILTGGLAYVDTSISEGEVVLDDLSPTIDTSQAYSVEIYIAPWGGAHHGKYRLYLRMDDESPVDLDEGVVVELNITGTDGSYDCTLTSYSSGTPTDHPITAGTLDSGATEAGWLTVQVSGDNISIWWAGKQLITTEAVDSHSGARFGFGMQCTTQNGVCLANVFRVQYYAATGGYRSMLVGAAGGNLRNETTYGRMTAVSSNLSLRSDVPLTACQSGQKLYIADYGDLRDSGSDGTVAGTTLDDDAGQDWTTLGINTNDHVVVISNGQGTATDGVYEIASVQAASVTLASSAGTGACSYRIERGPKVYDPSTNTLTMYTATTGQMPIGCPLIANYLDRIVFAGHETAPHAWYMARQSDETDWDYSQTDSQRAILGSSSEAGLPGEEVTALVPHSNDYLIIGCRNSLWRMRGDPAFGGSLDALSRQVGIIGSKAWCLGPSSELIFLTLNGLYALPPGGETNPIPLSREVLPQEFQNLNPDTTLAQLEFDVARNGVHVFLTGDASNSRYHWWFDWSSKTFWPMSITANYEPTASCSYQSFAIEDSGVILGCRDGYLRRMTDLSEADCGSSFSSYVVIGPMSLAPDGVAGKIVSMDASIAEDSGDVDWEVRPGLTWEAPLGASASDSGTWVAGINGTTRPACRGQAYTLKLSGETGRSWAIEQVVVVTRDVGRRRIA